MLFLDSSARMYTNFCGRNDQNICYSEMQKEKNILTTSAQTHTHLFNRQSSICQLGFFNFSLSHVRCLQFNRCYVCSQENGIRLFFFLEKNYLKFEWKISVSSKDFFSVEKDDRPFAYLFEFLELFSMHLDAEALLKLFRPITLWKYICTHPHTQTQSWTSGSFYLFSSKEFEPHSSKYSKIQK